MTKMLDNIKNADPKTHLSASELLCVRNAIMKALSGLGFEIGGGGTSLWSEKPVCDIGFSCGDRLFDIELAEVWAPNESDMPLDNELLDA